MLFMALILILTAGCRKNRASESAAEEAGSPLHILASTSIIGDIVSQIAGKDAEIKTVIPPGISPHAWAPNPRELAALEDADIIFVNGLGLEAQLLSILDSLHAPVVVELSQGIVPLMGNHDHEDHADPHFSEENHDHEGHADPHFSEENHDHEDHADPHFSEENHDHEDHADPHFSEENHDHEDHADPHFSEENHDHEDHADPHFSEENHDHEDHADPHFSEENHDHEDHADPHLWFSLRNVIIWTQTIADAFSAIDPENALSYTQAAGRYAERLRSLDDTIGNLTSRIPAEHRKLITDHNVLAYFAEDYGFFVIGSLIPSISDQAEPSAKHLITLQETIEEEGIRAIFLGEASSQAVRNLADSVSRIGARTLPVVSLRTASLAPQGERGDDYLDFILYNAELITQALSGAQSESGSSGRSRIGTMP